MGRSLQELENLVSQFAGDPAFVELAAFHRDKGEIEKALMICLRGIDSNPSELKGKLQLSRIFYELGLNSFAVRELVELNTKLPNNNNIKKLLGLFNVSQVKKDDVKPSEGVNTAENTPTKEEEGQVIAETEFDLDLSEKD